MNLRDDDTRLVDLAKRIGITKQSTGQMVNELQLAGFLDPLPNPNDKRAKVSVLTDKGHALRKEIRRAKQTIEDRVALAFSTDELHALRHNLKRLKEVVAADTPSTDCSLVR